MSIEKLELISTAAGINVEFEKEFKEAPVEKVAGHDVYMRAMCSATSAECDVLPLMWCTGSL